MPGEVQLTFASSGAAQVLAEQQRISEGTKAVQALYKQENREIAALARTAEAAFKSTRTEAERLEAQAKSLQAVIGNTKLPDIDRAKAADALKRVNERIKQVNDGLNKTGVEADAVGAKLKDAFDGGATAILGPFTTAAGAAAAAVGALISVVSEEINAIQESANNIEQSKATTSQSRNLVIRNLPGFGLDDRASVLAENAALASRLGVEERFINIGRAQALSASGGDRAASLAATSTAAAYLNDSAEDIGRLAGTLLDLSKVTGTNDANVNLGLLSTVGGLSRVVDPQAIAKNVPAALIGGVGNGLTTQESAALFGALSNASGDFEGAATGTAVIKLAEQLREFQAPGLEGLSTGQKLSALQRDAGLRDQFLATASFEAKASAPIRALLGDASSQAATLYAQQINAIPDAAGLRRRGQEEIAALEANPLNREARFGRAAEAAATAVESAAVSDVATDAQIAAVKRALVASGESNVGFQISAARGLDRSLSRDELAGLVADRVGDLERNLQGGAAFARRNAGDKSIQNEERQLGLLRDLLSEFREVAKNTSNFSGQAGITVGAD